MTNDSRPVLASPAEERDDRTRLVLASIVGEDRVDLSLTHFANGCVVVCASAATLATPNGMLAAIASWNMLSRFVGTVELRVIGAMTPAIEPTLNAAFTRLQGIDTRAGRTVHLAVQGAAGLKHSGPCIFIGDTGPDLTGIFCNDPTADVHIAFDGWTCALRRGVGAGSVDVSTVPFGALSAACFAVAEVFKTLVASSVPESELSVFRRRFVYDWRFSAWTMDRLSGIAPNHATRAPESLPCLRIDRVLQVGAGAVGNGAALAFASTTAMSGELRVLDPKCVDVKNLNRCYYFTEADIGQTKVDVLDRAATRPGMRVRARNEVFTSDVPTDASIILSTVDNNEVRHRMQEALPEALVEGATGETTVTVSVHRPGNDRSCLVCRHPDPNRGLTRRMPLLAAEAAAITGLTEEEIAFGQVAGNTAITAEVLERVSARSPEAAALLRRARDSGMDLCGALGDMRAQLGTVQGPREAAVPFVSNLAGVLAAAEVTKRLLSASGTSDVPLLDNVLTIDLARDYSRHEQLSYAEPPLHGCMLCEERAELVARVYKQRRQRIGKPE